jgi:hypothetical protein
MRRQQGNKWILVVVNRDDFCIETEVWVSLEGLIGEGEKLPTELEVRAYTIDGDVLPYVREGDGMRIPVVLQAGETRLVELLAGM